ncbi:MAG: molybdopterin-dependent oxidoreductase [Acidobacteria bacterium]|nr:molybdopterin-dependent oxidoreductase [Acidobacteriota bacterium]
MRRDFLLFTVLLVVSANAAAQTPAPAVLHVRAEGRTIEVGQAELAPLPRRTIETTDGGRPVRFEGIRLADVLARAGVTFGQTMRGERLAGYLLARASDGYRVVFALPEIDPDFAVQEIIIADRQDGAPLPSRDGPLRIIAAGDKRHARWVRGLVALELHAAPAP